MQSRRIIIGMAVLVIIVAGLGCLAWYFNRSGLSFRPAAKTDGQQESPDAAMLRNANREAIERASEAYTGMVKDITENDHVLGDRNAPVQMIIYCDFDCPFCAEFSDTAGKIRDEFGDSVAIVFRHFLLPTHAFAVPAALSAECADEQGKFWEMHDRMFADKKDNMMSTDRIRDDAAALGLDTAMFDSCLDGEKYRDRVEADLAEGRSAGAIGTPTVFLNGEILPGAVPYDDYIDDRGLTREGMRGIIERNLGKGN